MAPYADMSTVPNSLKGIDPPITLAQANMIARTADAIERRLKQYPPKKKTNPWAVAISQFKTVTHQRSGDGTRWVRRGSKEEASTESSSTSVSIPTTSISSTPVSVLTDDCHSEMTIVEPGGLDREHHFEGNNKPPVPFGKCSICALERIEIKPDHFACPGFYGSPTHYCDPVIFSGGDIAKRVEGYAKARQRLEDYCGCTLEEYLEARNRLNDASPVTEED